MSRRPALPGVHLRRSRRRLGRVLPARGPGPLAPRRPARLRTARTGHAEAQLPAALDLLAACLVAGTPVVDAIQETARVDGGEVGRCLAAVAVALRQGATARAAWDRALTAGHPLPGLAAVARACVRSERGGTPLEAVLTRLAAEQRAASAVRRLEAARRAGVLAVLPLGLCFLPAYLLLGVVPAVAGLAARFG